MTTRVKTKSKIKSTVVDTPFIDKPQAIPEATLFEQLSAQIPDDWRRRALALVAGLVTSVATTYAVAAVVEYAVVGALVLTNSAFISLLILMLGLILAMYIASKSSLFVYANIVNKNIDKVYSTADATVRGWFTTTKGVAT